MKSPVPESERFTVKETKYRFVPVTI